MSQLEGKDGVEERQQKEVLKTVGLKKEDAEERGECTSLIEVADPELTIGIKVQRRIRA